MVSKTTERPPINILLTAWPSALIIEVTVRTALITIVIAIPGEEFIMRARKMSAIVVAFVLALAIPFTAGADTRPDGRDIKPAPTSATTKADALSQGKPDVGVNFVGVPVVINIPTASLFQCPSAQCNQGIANASGYPEVHDLISDICYIPGSSTPWGGQWNLVYNQANGHVGFISTVFLSDIGYGFNYTTC